MIEGVQFYFPKALIVAKSAILGVEDAAATVDDDQALVGDVGLQPQRGW